MSTATIDDSEEHRAPAIFSAGGQQARVKALQQLAVSEDSPFNLISPAVAGDGGQQNQLQVSLADEQRLNNDIARQLRDETEEIKRQLELVKRYLNEFHLAGGRSLSGFSEQRDANQVANGDPGPSIGTQNVVGHGLSSGQQTIDKAEGERRNTRRPIHDFNDQQVTSADSQFHHTRTSSADAQEYGDQQAGEKIPRDDDFEARVSDSIAAKFRPLTGKTDCPNCTCDRRRSVCDKCISLQKDVVHQASDQQQEQQQQHQQQQSSSMTAQQSDDKIRRQPTLLTEQRIGRLTDRATPTGATDDKQLLYKNYDERPIRPAKKGLEDLLDEVSSQSPDENAAATKSRAKVIDQVVVPNKLYTIGRSLDDKRTKLAQAIEDLQTTIDKVKKRGDRLDQERKVAMLYRDQWKYGPAIGGSRSGSRESLARVSTGGQYQSRLDPNLARDTKAVMGFKHVEPSLKLRQYENSSRTSLTAAARSRQHLQSVPPKPKPRLSKLTSNNKDKASVAADGGSYRRATESSKLHSRSKSLESLPRQRSSLSTVGSQRKPLAGAGRTSSNDRAKTNFHNGKASSELDLSAPRLDNEPGDSDADQGVEEDLEEEIREDDLDDSMKADRTRQSFSVDGLLATGESRAGIRSRDSSFELDRPQREAIASEHPHTQQGDQDNDTTRTKPSGEAAKKFNGGWVPVFGETEVKTISRRPVERKVIILNGSNGSRNAGHGGANLGPRSPERAASRVATAASAVGRSILRTEAKFSTRPKSATRLTGNGSDRVLNEAKKKLQFANNLLEREHLDSRTKNQVIINRHRGAVRAQALRPRPIRTATPMQLTNRQSNDVRQPPATANASSSAWPDDSSSGNSPTNGTLQNLVLGANKEISRLEEMISEQQRLLLRLTSATATPACCHLHATSSSCRTTPSPIGSSQSGVAHRAHYGQTGRQLIGHLRDRLNKTKARLARTLEEERAKHQQLEQRFDSTLRKQSDLENENELLKQSLSKCIDTCLKDILSTFESLSEHLNESADGIEAGDMITTGPSIQTASSPTEPAGGPSTSSDTPLLANAARLIADNSHVKRMKSHIETIEQQRRGMFEELNQEKHKSHQLELELKQSRLELEQLIEARRRLETQLATITGGANSQHTEEGPAASNPASQEESASDHRGGQTSRSVFNATAVPTTSSQTNDNAGPSSEQQVSDSSQTADDPTSMTFSSIDLYRQYIQSMTPDLDAIRRERRMILSEFDNVKRLLSDVNT